MLLTFSYIFNLHVSWRAQCCVEKTNMCSRNPLVTSRWIALVVTRGEIARHPLGTPQASRYFVRVGWWRGANFDIARATLSALGACRIALLVAPGEF